MDQPTESSFGINSKTSELPHCSTYFNAKTDGSEVKNEKDEDIAFAGMSLNVLAQVASDRLEISESLHVRKKV